MEIHALAARGWSVSAISRHTGRDRKTVRRYLIGEGGLQRRAGSAGSRSIDPFVGYIGARFEDDPHLLGSVLYRELVDAGFERSYSLLVKEIARLGLRPVCRVCEHRRGRAVTIEIDHPPGEEIQFDWLELHDTPWGQPAYVLVGALSHSGRFRAVICEQMTIGHLAGALHEVLVGLGGTPRAWRTDRMATVVIPGSDRLNAQFAQIAKHYGVEVSVCPARRPQRKGVVEAAVKYITNSWWRGARVWSMAEAQQSLDRWTITVADRRRRGPVTVGELGAAEPLRGLPAMAFPAQLEAQRVVSRAALVAFDGNHYSVAPEHAAARVIVRARVGEARLEIHTAAGALIATHRRAPAGARQTIRTSRHASLLERAVLDAFTTAKPCRRKANRPPGQQALAELAALHGHDQADRVTVLPLERYAQLAEVAS